MTDEKESSLKGCRILVTRPTKHAENLCNLIEEAGAVAQRFPVIEITPPASKEQATASLSTINKQDLVIFISRNAVIHADQLMPTLGTNLEEKEIYVVGSGTCQELEKTYPKIANKITNSGGVGSEALLILPALQSEQIVGKRVLIIRGVNGRELLGDTMAERGAKVSYAEVYQRKTPEYDPILLKKIWHDEKPDAIVITSAEGLNNLVEMTDDSDRKTLFNSNSVVMSPRIQEVAIALGFEVMPEVVADASDEKIMQTLNKVLEEKL